MADYFVRITFRSCPVAVIIHCVEAAPLGEGLAHTCEVIMLPPEQICGNNLNRRPPSWDNKFLELSSNQMCRKDLVHLS